MSDYRTTCSSIPLTGSAPQIKWAKMLRGRTADQMTELGVAKLSIAIRPHVTEEMMKSSGCTTPANLSSAVKGICNYTLSRPSAREWIELRDKKAFELVTNSIKPCFDHWTKTQPFK
jgi:hypothetical protein